MYGIRKHQAQCKMNKKCPGQLTAGYFIYTGPAFQRTLVSFKRSFTVPFLILSIYTVVSDTSHGDVTKGGSCNWLRFSKFWRGDKAEKSRSKHCNYIVAMRHDSSRRAPQRHAQMDIPRDTNYQKRTVEKNRVLNMTNWAKQRSQAPKTNILLTPGIRGKGKQVIFPTEERHEIIGSLMQNSTKATKKILKKRRVQGEYYVWHSKALGPMHDEQKMPRTVDVSRNDGGSHLCIILLETHAQMLFFVVPA